MINSSIIIRSLVTFRNPLGLGISYERLEKAGITKLGVKICGNGTVYYWTRKERDILHVMVERGPSTNLAFIEERIVDRVIIVRSPVTS